MINKFPRFFSTLFSFCIIWLLQPLVAFISILVKMIAWSERTQNLHGNKSPKTQGMTPGWGVYLYPSVKIKVNPPSLSLCHEFAFTPQCLLFTTIAITYYFWFHSNWGQSITLLKNWDFVAQTIGQDLMIPFDSISICQCFLSGLEGCTFLQVPQVPVPLSLSWLGSMTSVRPSGEWAALLLLMSVCLSTSQGGFCWIVKRKHWSI